MGEREFREDEPKRIHLLELILQSNKGGGDKERERIKHGKIKIK
jgi:hypothetical protein